MYNFKTAREPFGRAFVNCESDSKLVRMAAGIIAEAKEYPISIDKEHGLCLLGHGNTGIRGAASVHCWSMEALAEQFPDEAEDFLYIRDRMEPFLEHHKVNEKYFTDDHKKLWWDNAMWGGTWFGHAVPDFSDIALYGTDFYRDRLVTYRQIHPGKDEFYDALLAIVDALDIYGKRFHELAVEMLKNTTDAKERRYLEAIRDTFIDCPKKPCRDFVQATIMYVMVYSYDGVDSPGYFDQYMYDFWKVTDPELRMEYLENIWQYFHYTRSWNLCIGGSDEYWNDRSNDLSYAILEVTKKYKYQTPNLTLRYHRNTPEKLLRAAYEAIATGCGMPALYNDEVVCPALERLGIPPHDSHLYVMNGCNQIDIQGKSHMGLEDGEVSFAKAVEYALHNGVSQKKGELVSIETGDPREFKTFEEFYDAFIKQLDYITDMACDMSNVSQRVWAAEAPNPLRSLLIDGCMEKGVDYKAGGPLYGHGQILAESIADAADSLAAVKKYVYEDKIVTMDELLDALDKDFEGYDELYKTLKFSELKFGNDIDYVDSIAQDIVDHFNYRLLATPTVRGGFFSGGCSPFTRAPGYGASLGTLPNGLKRDEHLIADSIGATPGCDVNGPTALINSCLKFDHTLAGSGFVLNLKFDKEIFTSPKGYDTFLAICKTYLERKGQMLTFAVVSADELIDAQKNPDQHRDLIVRVGGYSDYFVNISKELQDNVIARTNLKTV